MFNAISNLLMKVFLFVLVLSFALWGVADVFVGRSSDTIAKVGDTEISDADVSNAVALEVQKIRQAGGEVDAQQMDLIKTFLLHDLIKQQLIEKSVYDAGVITSDDYAVQWLRSQEAFRNEEGVFDKGAFKSYLRTVGQTERSFFAQLKRRLANEVFIDTITETPVFSEDMVELLYQFEQERRDISVITIPQKAVSQIEEPNTATLVSFYDTEKERFSAPEYREVSYLTFGKKDVSGALDISDEVLQSEYEARIDQFNVAETRHLVQLLFTNKEAANEAHVRLEKGEGFTKVAGKTQDDLGIYTKEELRQAGLFDDVIVDNVFAISKDAVTEPHASALGWHIFYVKEITAPRVIPFSEAKSDLQEAIIEERVGDELYYLSTKVEDALAGGSTLEEVAKSLGLTFKTLSAFDSEGNTQAGSVAKNLPAYGRFIENAFRLEEQTESSVVSSEDGLESYIMRVDRIIAPRAKALDEVRGRVIEAWKTFAAGEKLKELAETTAEAIQQAGDGGLAVMKTKAKNLSVSVAKKKALLRDDDVLPSALLEELFGLQVGYASRAYPTEKGEYMIAVVDNIISAPEDGAKEKAFIKRRIASRFANDLLSQYIAYLYSEYPVKVMAKQ